DGAAPAHALALGERRGPLRGERRRRRAARAGGGPGGGAEGAAAAHQPGRGTRRLPPAVRRPRAAGAVQDRAAHPGGAVSELASESSTQRPREAPTERSEGER